MTTLRRAACVLLVAASLFAPPAIAASCSTDQSDLWWANPAGSENGSGFQLVQRNCTIFATMFVYDPTGAPTWYVATMVPTDLGGQFIWSGDLYTTTGPWFGAVPYNPALFTFRKVGTMTWNASSVNQGTLSYSVDGVTVTKNAIRQTLVFDNFSGHYGGGIHEVVTGCPNPAFNGTSENIGILNITQNGAAITLQSFPATGGSCSYAGTLSQFGQMGDVIGSYTCSNGDAGTFHLFEMQVTITGLTGRFIAASSSLPGCQATGWFGGLVVTTF
jgi:hypothetical protein